MTTNSSAKTDGGSDGAPRRIAVLGLGNVLRKDDGFGPSAVRRLDSLYEFPESVELRDLGAPGLDLASHVAGRDAVLFLDAALAEGAPGTLRVFDRAEILADGARPPRVTGHDGDVREALLLADLAGRAPQDAWLIGVVPADLGSGAGISPIVAAALGPACVRALAILAAWGAPATRRAVARPTDAWWQDGSGAASGPELEYAASAASNPPPNRRSP